MVNRQYQRGVNIPGLRFDLPFKPRLREGVDTMPARILVAEDDSFVRTFVFKALSLRGHDVATVDDGVQAL